MGLRGVLLVCCQLLPVPAVQIHAKLSSSQVCRQKEEHFHFSSFHFLLQAHTEGPVLHRWLNEIAFKLFF